MSNFIDPVLERLYQLKINDSKFILRAFVVQFFRVFKRYASVSPDFYPGHFLYPPALTQPEAAHTFL